MRGRSGGFGHSRGSKNDVIFPLLMGTIIGFVGDMFYSSLGLYGWSQKSAGCKALTIGDGIQLAGFGSLGFFGIMMKSWTMTAFCYGGLIGSLVPKMLAANNMPRYGIFNFDPKTGSIASGLPRIFK
jgi:hypothetical protein